MQGSLKKLVTPNYKDRAKASFRTQPALRELTSQDDSIIFHIDQLLKKHYDAEVSAYSIYKDPNYLYFFKSLINNVVDRIFYCLDPESETFLGFAHFKIKGSTLVLNNIIISGDYQGEGIGAYLLKNSLRLLAEERNDFAYFELEVFEKNVRAFNWYIRMGMDVVNYNNWYNITSYFRNDMAGSPGGYDKASFTCVYDQNGFKQLMHQGLHIGTLINETHLIIRTEIDYNLWRKIHWYFKESALKSVCLVSKKKHDLFLIDKSFLLRIPFKKLEFT